MSISRKTARFAFWIGAVLVVVLAYPVSAVWIPLYEGNWPASWPAALESYRAKSKSGMNAKIERFDAIPFESRDDFEEAWPHLLSIMSKGGRITFVASGATYRPIGESMKAGVIVIGPSEAYAKPEGQPTDAEIEAFEGGKSGVVIKASEPWPYARDEAGELPEYVRADSVGGQARWVASTAPRTAPGDPPLFRARIDLVVFVDNSIVDWRRLNLPADKIYVFERMSPAVGDKQSAPLIGAGMR